MGATARECDVFVIGGGPAGSAAATFLARRGYRVAMAEKERHPRFHIGESLLPYSLPLLDELGVLDRVRLQGVHKRGAEFISEDGATEAVFDFSGALFEGPDHAYQVRRSDFDGLLFENAVAAGVEPLQETSATILALDGERVRLRADGPDGASVDWTARFLVDASGRSTVTANLGSGKAPDPRNHSAAIFGHFRGVPRQEGDRAGNIRLYLTEPGWMWVIPLPDDITSVGLVASGEYLAERGTGIEAFFRAHCARHGRVAALMAEARLEGRMRATGNFSYSTTQSCGSNHIKVGDAFAFIDPIFSTGVHLALSSAREAARAVDEALRRPAHRARLLEDYYRRLKLRLDYVSWFIYRIHEPAFREMLTHPHDILGVRRAIVSLLAGDFRADPRLRARVLMFKFFHLITRALVARRGRA